MSVMIDAGRAAVPLPAATGGETKVLPAWPVLLVLWGYPVWWALGLLPFAPVIMALPMLAFLILNRRIVVLPGILPWLAFVAWMIPSALMVDEVSRLLGLGMRFSQFLALAIMIVYIANAPATVSPRRILNPLTFIWVFIIIGGYLGMAFPEERLTLTVGRLLPDAIVANDYVNDLVFPPLAEIQIPWGAEEPFMRPSAPFAYSNGWGAAIAVLTPIAIATVIGHRTARSMWFLIAGLLALIPPAIATTNRGLFVGLGVGVFYVMIRLAARGRWAAFAWLSILSLAGSIILVLSGFLNGIIERQETVDTTEGRLNLYLETFERTLTSPVLGFGAPRPSFTSEIYVGTQGAIWNAMFCFGFVGLILFVGLLLAGALRTWDAPNLSTLWLHAAVVVTCLLSVFYGLDRHLVFVGAILAIMLREKYGGGAATYWTRSPLLFAQTKHGR